MNIDLSRVGVVPAAPMLAPVDPPSLGTVTTDAGKKSFRVKLEGEPEVVIKGVADRLEAQEVYNKKLGIISTSREYTYTEIE